jgi:hypothetical protein
LAAAIRRACDPELAAAALNWQRRIAADGGLAEAAYLIERHRGALS